MNHPIYFGNLSAIVMMMALSLVILGKNLSNWQKLLMSVAALGGIRCNSFNVKVVICRVNLFVALGLGDSV